MLIQTLQNLANYPLLLGMSIFILMLVFWRPPHNLFVHRKDVPPEGSSFEAATFCPLALGYLLAAHLKTLPNTLRMEYISHDALAASKRYTEGSGSHCLAMKMAPLSRHGQGVCVAPRAVCLGTVSHAVYLRSIVFGGLTGHQSRFPRGCLRWAGQVSHIVLSVRCVCFLKVSYVSLVLCALAW